MSRWSRVNQVPLLIHIQQINMKIVDRIFYTIIYQSNHFLNHFIFRNIQGSLSLKATWFFLNIIQMEYSTHMPTPEYIHIAIYTSELNDSVSPASSSLLIAAFYTAQRQILGDISGREEILCLRPAFFPSFSLTEKEMHIYTCILERLIFI